MEQPLSDDWFDGELFMINPAPPVTTRRTGPWQDGHSLTTGSFIACCRSN